MKIVIPGGSGQVGSFLTRALVDSGHQVVVLTRSQVGGERDAGASVRHVFWDGKTLGPWSAEIDGADAVINLAGRSVNCRYNARHRREIMDSRIDSTRVVGEAIGRATRPPPVWLQASTATIYDHRYDAPNDEITGRVGGNEPDAPDTWRFSIDVATAWEGVTEEADTPHTRKLLLRSAITMSPDRGGAFDVFLTLVRYGLGGKMGDGRQFVSWIHHVDFVRAVEFLIEREDLSGCINLAAPHPLPNADFMRDLRKAWGIRIGLPATRWMLEIGTMLMRSESELVLKSRRVVPTRLVAAGFQFNFPTWPAAATDLRQAWRERHARQATGAAAQGSTGTKTEAATAPR